MEGVRRILRNPIYWGPFLWKGKLYDGEHEPLVSKELFDEIQRARAMKGRPRRRKHNFAFTGMVFCKLISSNSTWDGVTFTPTYKKPFGRLAEGLLFVNGGADETRTRDLRRDRPAF